MTPIRRRIRSASEALLLARPKTVRRLLLSMARDEAPRPEILQVESTNLCNARCVFCPRDRMERAQGVMDVALFRKIADEAACLGIGHVRLHNYGEALIDRHLPEKIRYAKARGIPQIGLISNGSLLGEPLASALVEAGLDTINISVDAAGKETFERTRVGLNYDRVMGNIETLVRVRRDLGSRTPKLILSFVRQEDSADERAFIEQWSRIADKVHVTDLHNWAGTLHARSDVTFPCYRPWLTFTALWDGRVSLCCADFDGKVIVGDLRTQSIAEIWNGPPFRAVRRAHLEHGGPDICIGCDLPRKDSPLWVAKLFRRRRNRADVSPA